MLPPKYFRHVAKHVNERENEHETQIKKLHTRLVMYHAWETTVTRRVILDYLGYSSKR